MGFLVGFDHRKWTRQNKILIKTGTKSISTWIIMFKF